jgi:acetoin:2,6-dichlorophenolindophenol oxidoreductase subunit alpha
VSTPISSTALVENIADRAAGYGIPGVVVDGQDIIAVHEVMLDAVRRARAGEGPTLIEAKTYRYLDHAANMGRDLGYRTDAEIEDERRRDPIAKFRDRLGGEFGFTESDIASVEEQVADEVEDATRFARESPYPDPAQAFAHVYA